MARCGAERRRRRPGAGREDGGGGGGDQVRGGRAAAAARCGGPRCAAPPGSGVLSRRSRVPAAQRALLAAQPRVPGSPHPARIPPRLQMRLMYFFTSSLEGPAFVSACLTQLRKNLKTILESNFSLSACDF